MWKKKRRSRKKEERNRRLVNEEEKEGLIKRGEETELERVVEQMDQNGGNEGMWE